MSLIFEIKKFLMITWGRSISMKDSICKFTWRKIYLGCPNRRVFNIKENQYVFAIGSC